MTELPWKPNVFLPVNLTVRFGSAVLEAADPAPWCQQKAADLSGPGASPRQVSRLAEWLLDYAKLLRSKDLPTTAAMFFWPDFTHATGFAEVYLVGEDPVAGPMTLARAREMAAPDEASFGQTEMTETHVPAGPAFRVHRYRKTDPAKRRSRIGEEVAWFIWPPGPNVAVMMLVRWMEPTFSEAGITIADDMANNFRIKPTE